MGIFVPMRWYLITLFLLAACTTPSSKEWHEVRDRTGTPLYRIAVPAGWQRVDPTSSIEDSRLPNVTFEREGVTMVIHTFALPIPPGAQVERWAKQTSGGATEPVSFGGYVGLQFEADGVVAWAMELAPAHRSKLPEAGVYTLKATGDVAAHRQEIERMARSFGLLRPL